MPSEMVRVVCIIFRLPEGKVFITQRPEHKSMGLKWEFPGGKIEDGEYEVQALKREIEEELSYSIDEVERLGSIHHEYEFGKIELIAYIQDCKTPPIFKLTEHISSQWLSLDSWDSVEWAPADIPIVKLLIGARKDA